MKLQAVGRCVLIIMVVVAARAAGPMQVRAQVAADPTPIARAQADSARNPWTTADVRFISGMIPHHAQAIQMARWAATHGASAQIQTLAGRIINAQQDEIAVMQHWLRDRRQPVPEARATGMRMAMDGMEHDMLMPGMLTEDQMRRLDQARGAEFDRLFLSLMIQHHQGAVSMVKELLANEGAAHDDTIFKLAADINVDQTTEIARMQQLLAALLFEAP
ncbi:MAG TPA: DUF305 domain-containing protein [Gemmatimonadales bacterium]|nr:DUF305 domain-containing protein [Gemmatimonadales bacterium]